MEKVWINNWPQDIPQKLYYPLGEIPVHEYLRKNAAAYPDKPLVSYYGKDVSYREVDQASDRLANYFLAQGLKKGDRIGLFLGNCPQYIIAHYAVLKMGGIVSPLNSMFKEMELKYQINDCAMSAVVCMDLFLPRLKNIQRDLPSLKTIVWTNFNDYLPAEPLMPILDYMKVPRQNIEGAVDFMKIVTEFDDTPPQTAINLDEDLALIEYTGGTTGLPKGAMLSHRSHLFKPLCIAMTRYLTKDSIEVTTMPYFHIAGMTCMVGLVCYGATNINITQYEPVAVLTAISRYKATSIYMPVPNYVQLMGHPQVGSYDLSSLKYSLCTSFVISLSDQIAGAWEKLTGSLLAEAAYGLSETHTADTFMPFRNVRMGSCGLPTFETEIFLRCAEDPTKEVGLGEQGEILVRSPGCMKGFWNRPEASETALWNGYVVTGDIGVIDEDGFMWWKGRLKEMIKVSGYSVFPEEVESLLNQHPLVLESAVIPVPDEKKEEMVKAFVVLREGAHLAEEELIAWAKENMIPHKVPKHISFRTDLPKSGVKLLRRILRDEEEKAREAVPCC